MRGQRLTNEICQSANGTKYVNCAERFAIFCQGMFVNLKKKKFFMILSLFIFGTNQEIEGCLVVNPGRLSNPDGQNTFSRLVYGAKANGDSALSNYIACQVLKV